MATVATSSDFARAPTSYGRLLIQLRVAILVRSGHPNIAGHRHPPEPNEIFFWVARVAMVAADLPPKAI